MLSSRVVPRPANRVLQQPAASDVSKGSMAEAVACERVLVLRSAIIHSADDPSALISGPLVHP